MILKIFTQPNCPRCPPAKKLVNDLRLTNSELRIEKYDVTTVDGLAEASFYSLMATPSLILVDEKGKILAEWRGKVPGKRELLKILNPKF